MRADHSPRRTSPPARSLRRGPRTRRAASENRADWRGRSSRWDRGPGAETARRSSRTRSRVPRARELHAEAQAARHDRDLLRLDLEQPELGGEAQRAELRHDEQLAVRVVEEAPLHGAIRHVPVNAAAALRHPASRCRPTVASPATKSVGPRGSGSGSQRSWFGEAASSSNRLVRRPASSGTKRPCTAAGRMRYSQLRRLACRGAVKAVPENCSAYRP